MQEPIINVLELKSVLLRIQKMMVPLIIIIKYFGSHHLVLCMIHAVF